MLSLENQPAEWGHSWPEITPLEGKSAQRYKAASSQHTQDHWLMCALIWCSCITSSTNLTHYGRISSVQVFGQDRAGPNPSPANLKLHWRRRAVPGEMPSGCSDLQPFIGTSPRQFDGSLAAPGCWGYDAPFKYFTPGRKAWVAVKLNGTAEQAAWCCCRLEGSWG